MNKKVIQFRPRVTSDRLIRHLNIFFRRTVFNHQYIQVQITLVSFLDKISLGDKAIIDIHNINEIENYIDNIKNFYINQILYKIEPLKYNKLEIEYSYSSKKEHDNIKNES